MDLLQDDLCGLAAKENSPTSFEVEQNLDTMNGARTITFDKKTNHIFGMSQVHGPAPPPPPGGGRGAQGSTAAAVYDRPSVLS